MKETVKLGLLLFGMIVMIGVGVYYLLDIIFNKTVTLSEIFLFICMPIIAGIIFAVFKYQKEDIISERIQSKFEEDIDGIISTIRQCNKCGYRVYFIKDNLHFKQCICGGRLDILYRGQ
jgi:hypothetical protein